jgi:hypothetical protein
MTRDSLSTESLLAAGLDPKLSPVVQRQITDSATGLAELLATLDAASKAAVISRLADAVQAPPVPRSLSPQELNWVRGLSSEEEVLTGLKEVRETGGHQLADFLPDLERAAGGR